MKMSSMARYLQRLSLGVQYTGVTQCTSTHSTPLISYLNTSTCSRTNTRTMIEANLSTLSSPTVKPDSWLTHHKKGLMNVKSIMYKPVRFAGHSHWQNMKHTKAAMDALKSKASMMMNIRIKAALKDGGSTDPKLNRYLERVFLEGRALNVPMSTMLNMVKTMTQGGDKGVECVIEGKGHGGCSFMIMCYTENQNNARKNVSMALKRHGGGALEKGGVAHQFDHKGVVYVDHQPDKLPHLDAATETAIEVGAEDVAIGFNDQNEEKLKFYCDTKDLHSVKKALESEGLSVSDAQFEYIPHNLVSLTELDMEVAGKLVDALLTLDDVVRVYHNIESTESDDT